jgi:hypothetical protein
LPRDADDIRQVIGPSFVVVAYGRDVIAALDEYRPLAR